MTSADQAALLDATANAARARAILAVVQLMGPEEAEMSLATALTVLIEGRYRASDQRLRALNELLADTITGWSISGAEADARHATKQ